MNKRGMEASQIFIFVLSLVVVGLVLLFGTRAIIEWQSDVEQVQFIQFRTQIQDAVQEVSSEFGTVRMITINVPGKFDKLCFADLVDPMPFDEVGSTADTSVIDGTSQPLMWTEWNEQTANIFAIDEIVLESFLNEQIRVDGNLGYVCFENEGGRVAMHLEGIGQYVLVSKQ